MRNVRAMAVLAVLLSAFSVHAAWLDLPSREIGRIRIVKLIRKLVAIVNGDGLSEPKP
jgi:hypothetical protein